jgi:hypothetical protein
VWLGGAAVRMCRRLFVVAAFVGLVAVGLVVSSEAADVGGLAVMSVVFHGSVASPVVDIRGHGFGLRPAANPPEPPEPPYASTYLQGGSGCTTTTPPVGYDYGTSLYYSSGGPHSYTSGAKLSAGRYRPSLLPRHELDCVGLIVVRYTPTRITFKLGSDYAAHHYRIDKGDRYELGIHSLRYHGTVHYAN